MSTKVELSDQANNYNSICGPAPYGKPLSMITAVSFLAILVIAGVGMAEKMSPTVMGWSLAGIAGGLTSVSILGAINEIKNKNADSKRRQEPKELAGPIIISIVLGILSILTGCGIISSNTLGWCVFGPIIASLALVTIFSLAVYPCVKKDEANQEKQV